MGSDRKTVYVQELVATLGTTESFVYELATADLIHIEEAAPGPASVTAADAERVRLSCLLVRDLEVNLAGVEVILHMRESMVSMQRQFAEVLAELAELQRTRTS